MEKDQYKEGLLLTCTIIEGCLPWKWYDHCQKLSWWCTPLHLPMWGMLEQGYAGPMEGVLTSQS